MVLGKEGYAQSEVDDVLVSYDANGGLPSGIKHGGFLDPGKRKIRDIIEEMILGVAKDEGIASDRTFMKSRVKLMIEDRLEYPANRTKKRKEAAVLKDLLERRPELFRGE